MRLSKGQLVIKITHPDIPRLIAELTGSGAIISNVKALDALSAELTIPLDGYRKLSEITIKRNAQIQIVRKVGLYWKLKSYFQRRLLMGCTVAVLFLSVFIPSRIWFVTVSGNKIIPDKQIIEAAECAGIHFGAARRSVRSERAKNKLLEAMPELQWVGVNTSGCVAEISVSEKAIQQQKTETVIPNGIVALRDGVIRSVTILGGNGLCRVGQVVKAGELLISSYRDCGILIQREIPEGEILAETLREIEAVLPTHRAIKGDIVQKINRYSVRIGKKRINFYKGSGIYGTSCDKMYEEYCARLPGGLVLPITVIRETWVMRDSNAVTASGNDLAHHCKSAAKVYLLQQMIAGQVVSEEIDIVNGNASCRMTGQYRCLEMIGKVQSEELFRYYGEDD